MSPYKDEIEVYGDESAFEKWYSNRPVNRRLVCREAFEAGRREERKRCTERLGNVKRWDYWVRFDEALAALEER